MLNCILSFIPDNFGKLLVLFIDFGRGGDCFSSEDDRGNGESNVLLISTAFSLSANLNYSYFGWGGHVIQKTLHPKEVYIKGNLLMQLSRKFQRNSNHQWKEIVSVKSFTQTDISIIEKFFRDFCFVKMLKQN